MKWWKLALGFFGKYKWPLLIGAVTVYTAAVGGWSYMQGREAVLNEFAEAREAVHKKEMKLAKLEDSLNRELAKVATLREVAEKERIENAENWRTYVEANPDVACTVVDDDGLQYIQGIFESR